MGTTAHYGSADVPVQTLNRTMLHPQTTCLYDRSKLTSPMPQAVWNWWVVAVASSRVPTICCCKILNSQTPPTLDNKLLTGTFISFQAR
jgi:hypothetical protein